ncbi:MAG: GIY-YIG nuclease family protein [Bdellovibrionales bacterium]
MKHKQYFVYFITNWTGEVLYTGVTNNLERRLYEHQHKLIKGFSSKYNLNKLVYFECFDNSESAIKREKQIKNWSRQKKDFLVETMNPDWSDLSSRWYEDPSASLGMTRGETR